MKMKIFTSKFLLAAAALLVGGVSSAWADVTAFSESYSSSSDATGWSTGTAGRFTPVILDEDDNYYLSVDQSTRNNNGAVVTGTILDGKAAAGDDFTLMFDMRLSNSNNQTPVVLAFNDAANSGVIFSLTATAKNVTTWKVNGQDLTIDLPNSGGGKNVTDITWISYKISRSGSLTYLTVTNKETNEDILSLRTIDGASETGGLGKIVFTTKRYNANFAIDNIVLRALESGDVPAVTPVNYTIKYVDGSSNKIKDDVVITSYVGAEVTASESQMASIYTEGNTKKYIYSSGNNTITLGEDAASNVITLIYREAASYNYTVNAIDGDGNKLQELASGTAFEQDNIKASYPVYINVNGTLYTKGATSSTYYTTVSLDSDNKVIAYTYTATDIKNVVFITEGENISGASVVNTGNSGERSSNAASGYNNTGSDLLITALPAGSYSINAVGYFPSNGNRSINITDGTDNILTITQTAASNWLAGNSTFTLASDANIYLAANDANSALDFLYIQQTSVSVTIPSSGFATFSSANEVAIPTGVTAYYASEITPESVKLAEVTGGYIPANTGVILAGEAGTYTATISSTGATAGTNKLQAAVTATAVAANDAYVLYGGKFCLVTAASTVPAGKAYLHASDIPAASARPLTIQIGDKATGINKVQGEEVQGSEIYNLQGQRVVAPTKGLYIMNGKKVIIK